MEVHGFVDEARNSIGATIDGTRWAVPNDPANRHRQMIAEWEAEGNTIPPYVPPSLTPEEQRKLDFPNLEPDQFWFVVRASGYEPDLLAWVASMNDPESPNYNPVDWAAASSKLQFAKFFERDHPFVEAARVAIGMSEAELDALWSFATQ